MFKRSTELKKKKSDKEKAEVERSDGLVTVHPATCNCIYHRAKRGNKR